MESSTSVEVVLCDPLPVKPHTSSLCCSIPLMQNNDSNGLVGYELNMNWLQSVVFHFIHVFPFVICLIIFLYMHLSFNLYFPPLEIIA